MIQEFYILKLLRLACAYWMVFNANALRSASVVGHQQKTVEKCDNITLTVIWFRDL